MKNETDQFIAEGMTRYEQASSVLVTFRRELETILKGIMNSRNSWGLFIPSNDARAIKSTYGADYPLLNAKLEGWFNGEVVKIVIAVNWYQSQTEYPFYAVWFEPQEQTPSHFEQFEWKSDFEFVESALRFYPDPADCNLARDFNVLLDEFIRSISN